MDKEEFAVALQECHTLLRALAKLLPKHVDPDLLLYLDRIRDDPAGRELLRNAIAPK